MHKRTVTFTMWRPPWLHRCKPPPQSWLIGSRFMWGYPIRCFVTPPSTSLTTCAHPCGWGAKTCSTGTIFYLLVVRVRAGVRVRATNFALQSQGALYTNKQKNGCVGLCAAKGGAAGCAGGCAGGCVGLSGAAWGCGTAWGCVGLCAGLRGAARGCRRFPSEKCGGPQVSTFAKQTRIC